MREKLVIALAGLAAVLLAYNLYHIFLVLPDEASQGYIYRIIFFHVPAGLVGMVGFFVALVYSALYLAGGNLRYDSLAASIVEVSVIFSVVNLVTGSIWARVIWGVWWAWDYRLTSQLVCVLIFLGYLMMRRAIDEPTQRARLSAALTIFGCFDAVVVWKSIEWFRNNHPGPVLSIRTGGEQRMDPNMEHALLLNFLALLIVATALIIVRARQESTAREIDSLRRAAHV
jgi:heme exporter protein C